MTKVVFYGAALLIAALVISGEQNVETRQKVFRDLVEINGKTYFIDSFYNNRDDAKAICEEQNMTLVSFDDAAEWIAVEDWIYYSNLAQFSFWTGGVRDQGTTTWYWEPTGQDVSEFFWIPGQPDVDPALVKTCINFNADLGGWEDDDCGVYVMGVICE